MATTGVKESRFGQVFAFRAPEELVERIEKAAASQYETSSSLARRLMVQGLETLERGGNKS